MDGNGDFFSNEKSVTVPQATDVRIEFVAADGSTTVLKESTPLKAGEILDATFMSKAALVAFLEAQIAAAKAEGVLFSLHMKATMMKVSDPIIFGHAVEVFFKDLIAKHAGTLEGTRRRFQQRLRRPRRQNPNCPPTKSGHRSRHPGRLSERPRARHGQLRQGHHQPPRPQSDVIVDASMPAMIRAGGKMWNAQGKPAGHPRRHPGQLLRRRLSGGHRLLQKARRARSQNHGLRPQRRPHGPGRRGIRLAQQNLRNPRPGTVRVVDAIRQRPLPTKSKRATSGAPAKPRTRRSSDWVKLAVNRARASNTPAVFWLDKNRAHDAQSSPRSKPTCRPRHHRPRHPHPPARRSLQFTLERIVKGKDTISVTGNVLRDYLTDLFPILEVGTSAKMLSIVPLMNGGGLFETGAGGSAPKHVQQFVQENYLRWDSLGEFFALAASFEHLAETFKLPRPRSSPTRSTPPPASSSKTTARPAANSAPSTTAAPLLPRPLLGPGARRAKLRRRPQSRLHPHRRQALAANEAKIVAELLAVQGKPVDIGGYYLPDDAKANAALRPSATRFMPKR
jgi:isocitrate dehydrogenase